ncbi:hypothetical protein SDC9_121259 [bioreactor metagenome]|uniref:Uncharacterized protein n=1 Tax=bioreactor metagenome TaxID=1076179 RepID=A0A645CBH0_9ZZZZ
MPLLGCEDVQTVAHLSGEFSEAHRLRLDGNFAALHAGEREQRFDEVVESLRFLQHAANGFTQRSRIVSMPQRDLTDSAERSQRRAQFVRGVGSEALEFGEGIVEALQGLIEDGCQLAEFIMRIAHGQTFPQ